MLLSYNSPISHTIRSQRLTNLRRDLFATDTSGYAHGESLARPHIADDVMSLFATAADGPYNENANFTLATTRQHQARAYAQLHQTRTGKKTLQPVNTL